MGAGGRVALLLSVVLVAVSPSATHGGAETSENAVLAHAAELRAALGFDASGATVLRAASDFDRYPDTTWGIPMSAAEAAEMDRRVHVVEAIAPAVDDIATSDPTWAGIWYDQPAGGVPVLLFAADVQSKTSEVQARLPEGIEFRVAEVERTWAELLAVQGRITGAAEALRESGIPITGIEIDTKANQVVVSLYPSTPDAQSRVTQAFGAVLFREEPVAKADACPASSCTPIKGGIGITDQSGGGPCTLGYMALRTDTNPDDYVFVTAGHCAKLGAATWWHGGSQMGTVVSIGGSRVHGWFNNSGGDVGVVAAFPNPSTKNNLLVDESPVKVYPVEVQLTASTQGPGLVVCRMGRTTGLQCGPIANNCANKYSEVAGYTPRLILCTIVYDRDADGGDSGGPLFLTGLGSFGYYATILGTHVHSQDGYVPTGGKGWYTPWDRGIAELQSRFAPLTLSPCIDSSCDPPF